MLYVLAVRFIFKYYFFLIFIMKCLVLSSVLWVSNSRGRWFQLLNLAKSLTKINLLLWYLYQRIHFFFFVTKFSSVQSVFLFFKHEMNDDTLVLCESSVISCVKICFNNTFISLRIIPQPWNPDFKFYLIIKYLPVTCSSLCFLAKITPFTICCIIRDFLLEFLPCVQPSITNPTTRHVSWHVQSIKFFFSRYHFIKFFSPTSFLVLPR